MYIVIYSEMDFNFSVIFVEQPLIYSVTMERTLNCLIFSLKKDFKVIELMCNISNGNV